MNARALTSIPRPVRQKQGGLVLFFALIAMVILSLAAVALIRTVDTGTIIAGNLAFKKAATNAGDAGSEAAIAWLTATEAANSAKNVLTDTSHSFNNDDTAHGYYSSYSSSLNLFADSTWTATTSASAGTDAADNQVRYIIQRMCRTANTPIATNDCLFSSAKQDRNGQGIQYPQDICDGSGCPTVGQSPQVRITSRITGPRNTVSYVQAFVY